LVTGRSIWLGYQPRATVHEVVRDGAESRQLLEKQSSQESTAGKAA